MDEKEIINCILSGDPDIKIVSEDDGVSFFELFGSEYGIVYYHKDNKDKFPVIVIKNYEEYDYPHIMTDEYKLDGAIYRGICLYESDKIVSFLYSYEEKICETIERLKQLLQLTEREKEIEFQKEFLYYWNRESKVGIDVFLGQERCFQKLNLYEGAKKEYNHRLVSSGTMLNNIDKYKHVPNFEGYYIPITDNRRILPPVKGKPWTMKEIMNIIDGKPYCRISRDTFDKISAEKSKAQKVFLGFEMLIDNQSYNFGVLIEFADQIKESLLNRLKNKVKSITTFIVSRCDYYFLNKQIGNDTFVVGKKVAVVGCGSLGSYVVDDLVKVGIKNISLYDYDNVSYTNVLRHKAEFYWEGYKKVACMKSRLESIHPEVFVNMNGNITVEQLKEDMSKYDLIIFTVGCSDVQLSANQVFMNRKYDKPVMYVWLESGGIISHILTVDYFKNGCFECLFTNDNGEMINNKTNRLSEEKSETYTLRNGCGATRVAYGTSILLRTTSVVLDTVQKLFNGDIDENTLIDITPTEVTNNGNTFAEGKCGCCGDRDTKEMH